MIRTLLLSLLPLALWAQTPGPASYSAADQTQALAQALSAYYELAGELRLKAATELSELAGVPDKVEILEAPDRPASTMLVRARFYAAQKELATLSAAFKAEYRVEALVAKRQLSRKSMPQAADFSLQSTDALALRGQAVPVDADLSQYEVASTLPVGAVLTWAQLKPKPLVHKGSLVDVVIDQGVLKITSRAVAMADAGLNETVVLRNLTTNRQFQAKVINENLAQIYF